MKIKLQSQQFMQIGFIVHKLLYCIHLSYQSLCTISALDISQHKQKMLPSHPNNLSILQNVMFEKHSSS